MSTSPLGGYEPIPPATLPPGWSVSQDGRALACGGFVVRAMRLRTPGVPGWQMVAAWEGPDGRLDVSHAHVDGADFFEALRVALTERWARLPQHLRDRLLAQAARVVVEAPTRA